MFGKTKKKFPKKLSDHFYYSEFIRSDTAARDNIDNNCYDSIVVGHAMMFSQNILEKIRARFGSFRPNSWFRGEKLEKRIARSGFVRWCNKRGLKTTDDNWKEYFSRKQHPKGWACDVEVVGVSNDDLFEWCKENLEYDQLIRECGKAGQPYSGWVHISWNPEGNNRMQAFNID